LMVLGKAALHFKNDIDKEQEILMNIADMIIELYAAESLLLRLEKIVQNNNKKTSSIQFDITSLYLYEASTKISIAGKEALYSFASDDELNLMLLGLRRFTKIKPFNIKETSRKIADSIIANNGYHIFKVL